MCNVHICSTFFCAILYIYTMAEAERLTTNRCNIRRAEVTADTFDQLTTFTQHCSVFIVSTDVDVSIIVQRLEYSR